MQNERLKPHFAQVRADIVRVIGANAALFHADPDQVIVNGRIAVHAVFARELPRSHVRRNR